MADSLVISDPLETSFGTFDEVAINRTEGKKPVASAEMLSALENNQQLPVVPVEQQPIPQDSTLSSPVLTEAMPSEASPAPAYTPPEVPSGIGAVKAGLATAADVAVPTAAAAMAFAPSFAGTTALAAETGPAAPFIGFAGGMGGSLFAYWATAKAQEAALGVVAPEKYKEFKKYLEESKKTYPISTGMGELLPMAMLAKPSISNMQNAVSFTRQILTRKGAVDLTSQLGREQIANLASVAFGAGTALAAETVRQASEGDFNFTKLAVMTLAGSLLTKETALNRKLSTVFVPAKVSEKPSIEIKPLSGETAPPASETTLSPPEEDLDRINEFLSRQAEQDGKGTAPASSPPAPAVPPETAPAVPLSSTVPPAAALPLTPEQSSKEQFKAFSKLVNIAITSPEELAKKGLEADVINFDPFNVAVTNDPIEAAKAMAVVLKDDLKLPTLTAEARAAEARDILRKQGFGEIVAAVSNLEKTMGDGNYQIIAARYMAEAALSSLKKAEQVYVANPTEANLVDAVSAFMDTGRILFPLRQTYSQWGKMGHSMRNLPADVKNMNTLRKVLAERGITDLGNLSTERAEKFIGWVNLAMSTKNPKAFAQLMNMRPFDLSVAAASELLTGAIMGVNDTAILNAIGGVANTVAAPVAGTLSDVADLIFSVAKVAVAESRTIKNKQLYRTIEKFIAGSGLDEAKTLSRLKEAKIIPDSVFRISAIPDQKKALKWLNEQSLTEANTGLTDNLIELQSNLQYFNFLRYRFKYNMKAFWAAFKTSEVKFGMKASKFQDMNRGMPVDRTDRIVDPKGWGERAAKAAYRISGPYRSQGIVSSETFNINPKENPVAALLVDTIGETFRAVHRTILSGDEFIKASNAYAAARSRLWVDGKKQGLSGNKLESFIDDKIELLLDSNNRLYTRQRVVDETRVEVNDEGYTGTTAAAEIERRVDDRFNNELGALAQFADDHARQITYQSELGKRLNGVDDTFGAYVQKQAQKYPMARLMLGFYFIPTPINIFKDFGRYIPTAHGLEMAARLKINGVELGDSFPALRNIQLEYTKAHLSGDPFRIKIARGKQLLGGAITLAAYELATSGTITGAPPLEKNKRKIWLSQNLPYAFKINKSTLVGKAVTALGERIKTDFETPENYFFEFKRIHESTSGFFMAAADIVQYAKDPAYEHRTFKDFTGILMSVAANQVAEKVFLNNIKQFVDLYQGIKDDTTQAPEQLLKYFGRRLAPLAQPVLEAQDQKILELNNFSQQIARREPGPIRDLVFGKNYFLPRAYNVLGEDIDAAIADVPLIDQFMPFYMSAAKSDPLMQELILIDYEFSAPERHVGTLGGKMWDIRRFQYTSDVAEANKDSKELLKARAYLGVTGTPEPNQDAYDRWQQNSGMIKLEGLTMRERMEKRIQTDEYKKRVYRVSKGEANGRGVALTEIRSKYMTAALELTKLEYPALFAATESKSFGNQILRAGGNREQTEKGKKEAVQAVEKFLGFPNNSGNK